MKFTHSMSKLTAAALGALAVMSAAPAMAGTTIDFESVGSSIYGGTEVFHESEYALTVIDTPAAGPGGTGFAGAVGDGSDEYLCALAACPTGNTSHYYLGVNDGSLKVERADSRLFQVSSLDYAFLAPLSGLAAGSYGQLTLVGVKADGVAVSYSYDFPVLDSLGYSPFVSLSLAGTLGNTYFSSVTVGSCLFDGSGGCISPLPGSENQSQFALDNLQVAAIPEPETYAMMGLGLGLVGWMSRRRARAAKTVNNNIVTAA
ncbi:MAG: NF038120 family PEP-CTERM protein [Duganella sp.]